MTVIITVLTWGEARWRNVASVPMITMSSQRCLGYRTNVPNMVRNLDMERIILHTVLVPIPTHCFLELPALMWNMDQRFILLLERNSDASPSTFQACQSNLWIAMLLSLIIPIAPRSFNTLLCIALYEAPFNRCKYIHYYLYPHCRAAS